MVHATPVARGETYYNYYNLRDPLDGPCVIPVYTQAGLDEVRSWATASPPVRPVTCVDFISPAPSQKVLVLVPRAPGPTVRLATLHSLSAQCPGPKPLSIAVSPELDDKALNADAKVPEWANFRLTLAREFCDAERFAAGKARPQALPALLLPKVTVGLIIRTFAVAVYDTELTCLFRVRKADAAAVLESARALPSGAFLSPQRSQSHTVTWLQRASGQSASAYLASATEALGKATEHCCLAYRPGGRSNLGIWGSLEATKAVAHNGVGTIAPRWVLTGAPKYWVTLRPPPGLPSTAFQTPLLSNEPAPLRGVLVPGLATLLGP